MLRAPSRGVDRSACLLTTTEAVRTPIRGAAPDASLWVAAAEGPEAVRVEAVDAFRHLASGLPIVEG